MVAGRIVYVGGQADPTMLNMRGKVYQQDDAAKIVTNNLYAYKRNLFVSIRRLLQNYKGQVDWSLSPALESETFTSSTTYDAFNRYIRVLHKCTAFSIAGGVTVLDMLVLYDSFRERWTTISVGFTDI